MSPEVAGRVRIVNELFLEAEGSPESFFRSSTFWGSGETHDKNEYYGNSKVRKIPANGAGDEEVGMFRKKHKINFSKTYSSSFQLRGLELTDYPGNYLSRSVTVSYKTRTFNGLFLAND